MSSITIYIKRQGTKIEKQMFYFFLQVYFMMSFPVVFHHRQSTQIQHSKSSLVVQMHSGRSQFLYYGTVVFGVYFAFSF